MVRVIVEPLQELRKLSGTGKSREIHLKCTRRNSEDLAMRSQFVTASKRNIRFTPFAFSEHGAVMLVSVLRSEITVQASVNVVRAFVNMRSILNLHRQLAEKIEALEGTVGQHDKKFAVISELLSELFEDPKSSNRKISFIEK